MKQRIHSLKKRLKKRRVIYTHFLKRKYDARIVLLSKWALPRLIWFHQQITRCITASIAIFLGLSVLRIADTHSKLLGILAFVSMFVLMLSIFVSVAIVENMLIRCIRQYFACSTTDVSDAIQLREYLIDADVLVSIERRFIRCVCEYYYAGYANAGYRKEFKIEYRKTATVRNLSTEAPSAVATA